jgi:hypothetical protein
VRHPALLYHISKDAQTNYLSIYLYLFLLLVHSKQPHTRRPKIKKNQVMGRTTIWAVRVLFLNRLLGMRIVIVVICSRKKNKKTKKPDGGGEWEDGYMYMANGLQ